MGHEDSRKGILGTALGSFPRISLQITTQHDIDLNPGLSDGSSHISVYSTIAQELYCMN